MALIMLYTWAVACLIEALQVVRMCPLAAEQRQHSSAPWHTDASCEHLSFDISNSVQLWLQQLAKILSGIMNTKHWLNALMVPFGSVCPSAMLPFECHSAACYIREPSGLSPPDKA